MTATGWQIYWAKLKRKTVQLNHEEDKMNITIKSFKKQLERAYRAGQLDSYIEHSQQPKDHLDVFSDLFKTK